MKFEIENLKLNLAEQEKKKKEEEYLQKIMYKELKYNKKTFIENVRDLMHQGKNFNEAFMLVLNSAKRLKDYDQIEKPVLSTLEKKLRSRVGSVLGKRGADRKKTLKEEKAFEGKAFTPQEWRTIESGAKVKDLQERKIEAGKGKGSKRLTQSIKIKKTKVEKQLDLFT